MGRGSAAPPSPRHCRGRDAPNGAARQHLFVQRPRGKQNKQRPRRKRSVRERNRKADASGVQRRKLEASGDIRRTSGAPQKPGATASDGKRDHSGVQPLRVCDVCRTCDSEPNSSLVSRTCTRALFLLTCRRCCDSRRTATAGEQPQLPGLSSTPENTVFFGVLIRFGPLSANYSVGRVRCPFVAEHDAVECGARPSRRNRTGGAASCRHRMESSVLVAPEPLISRRGGCRAWGICGVVASGLTDEEFSGNHRSRNQIVLSALEDGVSSPPPPTAGADSSFRHSPISEARLTVHLRALSPRPPGRRWVIDDPRHGGGLWARDRSACIWRSTFSWTLALWEVACDDVGGSPARRIRAHLGNTASAVSIESVCAPRPSHAYSPHPLCWASAFSREPHPSPPFCTHIASPAPSSTPSMQPSAVLLPPALLTAAQDYVYAALCRAVTRSGGSPPTSCARPRRATASTPTQTTRSRAPRSWAAAAPSTPATAAGGPASSSPPSSEPARVCGRTRATSSPASNGGCGGGRGEPDASCSPLPIFRMCVLRLLDVSGREIWPLATTRRYLHNPWGHRWLHERNSQLLSNIDRRL